MKTFIFGAGASLHAGYPLASELWQAMKIWAHKTFPAGHDFTSAAATMNKEFDLSKSFELVLMDLDNRIELHAGYDPADDSDLFQFHPLRARNLVRGFCKRDADGRRRYHHVQLRRLAGQSIKAIRKMEHRRWIRFFCSAFREITVWAFQTARKHELVRRTVWRFNGFWADVWSTDGAAAGCSKAEFDYLGYEDGSDPQCHDGRVRIESIIMPTANKKFFLDTSAGREWQGFWDSIWSQAAMALKRSSEIYLIGYSIPEYDTRARELIRSQIRRGTPVRLCCHSGTPDVIQVIKSLGHVDVCATHPQTFEGWTGSSANLHG